MYRMHRVRPRPRRNRFPAAPLLAVGLLSLIPGCQDAPTAPATPGTAGIAAGAPGTAAGAPLANARFVSWHQGFDSGTDGWYGGGTPGPIGWCGTVDRQDRGGTVTPSAGTGYGTVGQGDCNAFWDGIFSGPGATLVTGPWAPGPDFSIFSDAWPASGFVVELDIYLDPAWTAAPLAPGTINFFAPPGSVFTYAVSLRDLASTADAFGSFHYFAVPVLPGGGHLSILGHSVTEPGWYTFRHVFRDEGGELSVAFQLRDRTGGVLFTEPITTQFFAGLPTSDLQPAELGSGYIWFMAISPGLDLPIDEHRVRPGR